VIFPTICPLFAPWIGGSVGVRRECVGVGDSRTTGVDVAVGGTGVGVEVSVAVGGTGVKVAVRGIGVEVAVGGAGVDVAVGGTGVGVLVGRTGIGVLVGEIGAGVVPGVPHPTTRRMTVARPIPVCNTFRLIIISTPFFAQIMPRDGRLTTEQIEILPNPPNQRIRQNLSA
jgi:hypothetical protein